VAALDHRLHERPQEQRVADGDEVHGAAHQLDPDGLAVGQQAAQLVRVEAGDARLQAEVGRERGLGLQAEEVLDDAGHVARHALQQQLPGEQRAVELTPAEDHARII
jgi:hypothetical protein